MATVFDVDVASVIKLRLRTVKVPGQGGFREDEIQSGQNGEVLCESLCVGDKLGAQGHEDELNLPLFLDFQLPHLIIQTDHGHGLDKYSGACG